jgi:CRP-like cAMP-binding protein
MCPITISPFSFLEQIPELQGLPKQALNSLSSKSSILEFADNEVIFHRGGTAKFFYFVIEGKVSMGECSKAGRESVNCIAGRKDLFCCLPALDMNPYPVTAISIGLSKVIRIPTKIFQEVCLRHPATYQIFVTRVCSNLRQIEQRHGQRMESATSRIALLLVGLNKKSNHPIRLTRAEVAKLVGVTVETTIRTLSQLGKKGIIQSKRGLIKIIDKDKLYELSELPPAG